MGDDDNPDPKGPKRADKRAGGSDRAARRRPARRVDKRIRKRTSRKHDNELEDWVDDETEGLPESVIPQLKETVVLGFSYPPEPDEVPGGEVDDPELEITGPFGFLDRALDWFRRAPVMGTIILVFGSAVIVVPIVLFSLDGDSTEGDQGSIEFIDEEASGDADGTGSSESEADDTGSDDTGSVDTESDDAGSDDGNTDDGGSGEGPSGDEKAGDIKAGVYTGTAMAEDPCEAEGYQVNFRFTNFNNGATMGEQLFTPGGNAFGTSEGKWTDSLAYSLSSDQVWVFMLGERFLLYNAYSQSGSPPRPPDIGDLSEGMSDQEFAEAFGLSPEACVVMFSSLMFDYMPFPESNPAG